jgi:hypothetical protein
MTDAEPSRVRRLSWPCEACHTVWPNGLTTPATLTSGYTQELGRSLAVAERGGR